MKAIIKETGQSVEVVSRFMPKKRNAPSRAWVCVLSDDRNIDEDALVYIEQQHPRPAEESGELPEGVTKRDVRLRFLRSINGKKTIEKMDASFYDESISYYYNLCRFIEKVRQENRWRELWDAMSGIANKPQSDANRNEPTREQKADFLQTNDADKEAVRRECGQVRIRPCWAAIKEKAKRIIPK